MVSDAIAAGDINAINYFVAQRYVEAFEKLASSPQQRTVIVPAELGALTGVLAGVKELIGAAGQGQAPTQARAPVAPRPAPSLAAPRRRCPRPRPADGLADRTLPPAALLGVAGGGGHDPHRRGGHRLRWLLWAAASAAAVGYVAMLAPDMGLGVEIILWSVLSVVSTFAAKRFLPSKADPGDINDNVERLIGRTGQATSAFNGGYGRVAVEGCEWAAQLEHGETLPRRREDRGGGPHGRRAPAGPLRLSRHPRPRRVATPSRGPSQRALDAPGFLPARRGGDLGRQAFRRACKGPPRLTSHGGISAPGSGELKDAHCVRAAPRPPCGRSLTSPDPGAPSPPRDCSQSPPVY
jgi:membrane protein implicated in regulation of membrane protease activity